MGLDTLMVSHSWMQKKSVVLMIKTLNHLCPDFMHSTSLIQGGPGLLHTNWGIPELVCTEWGIPELVRTKWGIPDLVCPPHIRGSHRLLCQQTEQGNLLALLVLLVTYIMSATSISIILSIINDDSSSTSIPPVSLANFVFLAALASFYKSKHTLAWHYYTKVWWWNYPFQ